MRLLSSSVLSLEEMEKIHDATLTILEKTGIEVHSEKMIRHCKKMGANVDFSSKRVKFPRELSQEKLTKMPAKIPWYNQQGELDLVLGSGRPHSAMGHNAIYMQDFETGERRKASIKDVRELTIVADQMKYIDVIGVPVNPWEVDPDLSVLYAFKTLMEYTDKPLYFATDKEQECMTVIKMADSVYDEDLVKKPYVLCQLSPTSPLFFEEGTTDALYEVSKLGLPVVILPEPLSGISSPYTIAGLLTQCNVEIIGGIIMAQLVNPGCPCVYGTSWTTYDMKKTMALIGSPETHLLRIAGAQMADYYGIPAHTTAPNTDANCHDEQMAWEKVLSQYASMTSGNDFIVNCGMFATGLTFSLEQLVLDNEIVGTIKRMMAGIKVNKDTIGSEVIEKIGPKGNFIIDNHTLNYLGTGEHYEYSVSNIETYEDWLDSEQEDVVDKARNKVKQILNEEYKGSLADSKSSDIEQIIKDFK